MRRRHHFATTGSRMFIDVTAELSTPALVFPRDPRVEKDGATSQSTAMMGDIVAASDACATIRISVHAGSGIESIELRDGPTVLKTLRPYGHTDLGRRLRLTWSGAEYRGRGRNTFWQGAVKIQSAEIDHVIPLNRWNPERLFDVQKHS